MTTRFIGGLAAALLFLSCAAVARGANVDPCWQLLYHALEHNALAPHAPYISYAESIHITQDGQPYERADANVTYRDDGLAYVDDDRWVHPFVSTSLEPGPPVLGPYGPNRASWLSLDAQPDPGLPVIAETRNYRRACLDVGDDVVDGVKTAHLVIGEGPGDQPGLKGIWIDRTTFAVHRAIVSQWLTFLYDYSGKRGQQLVDYTIAVQQLNGFSVIRQVNWSYTYKVYTQYSTIDAEYRFGGFHFDSNPPVGTLFATLH